MVVTRQPGDGKFTVQSESDYHKFYWVTIPTRTNYMPVPDCNCHGFAFGRNKEASRTGRPAKDTYFACKHIQRVMRVLTIGSADLYHRVSDEDFEEMRHTLLNRLK